MTKQLTPAQIKQLRVFLADYGLEVKAKPKKSLAALRAWKPSSPAGAKCKSRMLMFASMPPIKGISDYQVRDRFGDWLSPDHPAFDNAVAYRKAQDAKALQAARMRNEFLTQ